MGRTAHDASRYAQFEHGSINCHIPSKVSQRSLSTIFCFVVGGFFFVCLFVFCFLRVGLLLSVLFGFCHDMNRS